MKQKTLSQKGFELDPNSLNYNTAYYKEDVKQFIKEILDEIEATKENIAEGVDNYGYDGVVVRNNFDVLKQIIKQKAGKELLEND